MSPRSAPIPVFALLPLLFSLFACVSETAPLDPEEDPPDLNAAAPANCPARGALQGTIGTGSAGTGANLQEQEWVVTASLGTCPSRTTTACGGDGAEQIWRFVAPASGVLTARTCGTTAFNTVVSVGTTPGGSEIGCNNDHEGTGPSACNQRNSRMAFEVTRGQTYFITVDGMGASASGLYALTLVLRPCAPGQAVCNEQCVDLQTASNHCGACQNRCTGGRVCTAGACACPEGRTLCGDTCVDTRTSAAHCGACGSACRGSQVCCNGACAVLGSPLNCGACGAMCAEGAICQGGSTCTCPSLTRTVPQVISASGTYSSRLYLTCPSRHSTNCQRGTFGTAGEDIWRLNPPITGRAYITTCGTPFHAALYAGRTEGADNVGTSCSNSQRPRGPNCRPDFDEALFIPVTAGRPMFVTLDSERDSSRFFTTDYVINVQFCTPDQVLCDNGCTSLQTDAANCGACGVRCAQGATCVAGACTCPAGATCDRCTGGQTRCRDVPVCRDTLNDPNHCGACDNACRPGLQCCNGACTRTVDDTNHCGQCGYECGSGSTCDWGACSCAPNGVEVQQTINRPGSYPGRTQRSCGSRYTTFCRGSRYGASSPEDVWRVVMPQDGTVTVTTCGSSFDATLYAGATPGSDSVGQLCSTGNATGLRCAATDATLTFPVRANQPIFVTIDGNTTEVGDYSLNVTFRP